MAKLTLDNFEANTPTAILKRGRNYFDNGYVSLLDELDDGSWAATVDGSDRYGVQVQLKGKQISGYECDCPYDGDPCKHVVAVWYAIRGTKEQGGAEPKKNKKISLDTLLKDISTEEFRAFVKDLASRDTDFRTDFELYFADKGGVDVEKRYADVIRKIIRKHTNRGYIEYRSTRSFSSDVDKIIGSGTDYVNKGNYRDAFMLVKAIVLPLLETMSYADDSAGHIGGCINDTTQLLADLASNPDTPRPLLMDMLDYLLAELTNSEYFNYGDFGWELFACLEDVALKLDEADRLLSFIDMKLAALTGEYDRYDRTQLVRTKMFVLEQTGRKPEADALEYENLHVFEIRESVVAEAIDHRDYKRAKALIAEGIRIAEEQRYPGNVSSWESDLLKIAALEEDITTIRRLCKKIAFAHHSLSIEHYRRWKATYSQAEWAEVIETHIRKVIAETTKAWKSSKTYWKPKHPPLLSALDSIYIEEGFTDRLFALVKQENKLESFLRYHDDLKKEFAQELVALYPPLLEDYGHQTSARTEYADLVRKMKRIIKDLPAARASVLAVAQRLKTVYSVKPRRPAMLEELAKLT